MTPKVEWIGVTRPHPDGPLWNAQALDIIEYAGRWDYGQSSVSKMSGEPQLMIARWLGSGEESMVEMISASFFIECSRVVSHELVRHRIASYQQESQRFVKYDEERPEALYYVPPEVVEVGAQAVEAYRLAILTAHSAYLTLKRLGVKSQIARYVLPNATRTRIIAAMNLREWRHVLRLRMHTSAQPEMQEIARQIHALLQAEFGTVLFPDDIAAERGVR